MNIGELAKFRGGIATDTISEQTSASGVTIDSMLIKDGKTSVANIETNTSGVAPAAGVLGQKIDTSAISNTSLTTSEADVTGASISLTAGVWEIRAQVGLEYVTGANTSDRGGVICKLTTSGDVQVGTAYRRIYAKTAAAVGIATVQNVSMTEVVSLSDSATYKLRAYRFDTQGTGSGTVNAAETTFYAIRIG